jgi:hypothetical protein
LLSLRRSATEAGVTLAGVQVQQRPATREALARGELTVSMRGAYPQLIQALAELLGNYPNAAVMRANMRRSGPPDQVEATIVIGLFGAPSLLPASGGEATQALNAELLPTSTKR